MAISYGDSEIIENLKNYMRIFILYWCDLSCLYKNKIC